MNSTEDELKTERSLTLKHVSRNEAMKGQILTLDESNQRLRDDAQALELKLERNGYLHNQLEDLKSKNMELTKKVQSNQKCNKEKTPELCPTVSIVTFTQNFPPESPARGMEEQIKQTQNESLVRESHDDYTFNSGICDDEYLSPARQHNLKSLPNTFAMNDMQNSLSTIEIPNRIKRLRKRARASTPPVKKNLFNLSSFYDTEALVADAEKHPCNSDLNLNTSSNLSDFINDTEPTFGKLSVQPSSPLVMIGKIDMKNFEKKYGITNNTPNQHPSKRRRKFYIISSSDSE